MCLIMPIPGPVEIPLIFWNYEIWRVGHIIQVTTSLDLVDHIITHLLFFRLSFLIHESKVIRRRHE